MMEKLREMGVENAHQPTFPVWHFHVEPSISPSAAERQTGRQCELNTRHLRSNQTSMCSSRRDSFSYWLWNTFSPYSSVTKPRDRTKTRALSPITTIFTDSGPRTVPRLYPALLPSWCGTHREHVRNEKTLEWLSNAASPKACQLPVRRAERRDRTNDVCRVPCSVPASSPSTSGLPSATDVRRPHRPTPVPSTFLCPVCVSASRSSRRVQCQSLSNYSPAVGGHALYTHDAVVIHSPLQSTACGCSPQPAPDEPATGQTGDEGEGRGEPTSPVGSESDPASVGEVGEVGAHEGHQGLLSGILGCLDRPSQSLTIHP